MKNYYDILGVKHGASHDDIKKAYRRLAHEHHPDKTGGDEGRFKEINEAYYVLSDPKRRSNYDRSGTGPGVGIDEAEVDFSVFTEGFESWFGDIMGDLFGGGFSRRGGTRGRDLALELTVNLEQVLTGLREEVAVTRWAICDRCRGSGGEPGVAMKTCEGCSGAGRLHRVEQTFFGAMTRLVRCPTCQGSGEIPETLCTTCKGAGRMRRQDRVTIELLAGMEDGETFVVKGEGDAPKAPRAGKAGDLYVTVHIAPHPQFRREGDDFWVEEEVSFLTLVRGGSTTVKALDGTSLKLKIPKGTPSGKVFRIVGKGLPRRRAARGQRAGRGNLFVTTHAHVPQKPSRRFIEKLKDLSDDL